MAPRRTANMTDAIQFYDWGFLNVTLDEVKSQLADGGTLEIEHSSFSDSGRDYSYLYLNGSRIGHWPGY